MAAESSEKILVAKLKSNNSNETLDALTEIQNRYAKNKLQMTKLRKHSVIEILIPFLEHPKFCSISSSIVADGCLELSFVNEVIKFDGIKCLIRIMKSLVNENIQNRACRALGNMAKFEIGFKAIHKMMPISSILHFLKETSNEHCQQTAVRTLMILGRSSKTRKLIEQENGISQIAKLLHSSNINVLNCSIKALINLTEDCNITIGTELLQFPQIIIELNNHSQKSVRNNAFLLLKNLSIQESLRTSFVKVGAVKLLVCIISEPESHEMKRLAALVLCNFVDHMHMWSHNGTERSDGFKALLTVLQNENFQDIHLHIISRLLSTAHSIENIDILFNLGIMKILIQILNIFIKKNICKFVRNCTLSEDGSRKLEHVNYKDKSYSSKILAPNITFMRPAVNCLLQEIEYHYSHYRETIVRPATFYEREKSPDIKFLPGHSYNFPSTSDYSGSCSPQEKNYILPEIKFEFDCASPSTSYASSGVWSPPSCSGDWASSHNPPFVTCWSPVVSPQLECHMIEDETKELREVSSPKINKPFSPSSDITNNLHDINKPSTIYDISMSQDKTCLIQNKLPNGAKRKSYFDVELNEAHISRKILKRNSIEHDLSLSYNESSTEIADKVIEPNLEIRDKLEIESWIKSVSCGVAENLIPKQENAPGKKTKTIDYYVLKFLLEISYHQKKSPNSQIADKACFSVLMHYACFTHFPESAAKHILCRSIENRFWFEKLVVNGFFTKIEETLAMIDKECILRTEKTFYDALIDKGRRAAESDFGIGTLSHILVTSEKIIQCHTLRAITKLLTGKSAYKLLYQAKALSILFNLLSDKFLPNRQTAMICLCELYQSLTIQHIRKCCIHGTCLLKNTTKCFYKNSSLDVKFSVNNGKKILANREKLCENSEYFNALLSGHFAETNTDHVSITDISFENLSIIFHFLHGCGSTNYCPYIKLILLSVLLELLSDCDKFLLVNIKAFVEDRLCHQLLPTNVSQIYKQSKIHNSPALAKRALAYALSLDIEEKNAIYNVFEKLINLESNINFLGDLDDLLKNSFKMCCDAM